MRFHFSAYDFLIMAFAIARVAASSDSVCGRIVRTPSTSQRDHKTAWSVAAKQLERIR